MTTATRFIVNERTTFALWDNRVFGFTAFCKERGITWDREPFYNWLKDLPKRACLSLAAWERYYSQWEASQEYRDLIAADRHDDGEGLRHDPHFDACIG